jgi:hypothetical protein
MKTESLAPPVEVCSQRYEKSARRRRRIFIPAAVYKDGKIEGGTGKFIEQL